LPLLIF